MVHISFSFLIFFVVFAALGMEQDLTTSFEVDSGTALINGARLAIVPIDLTESASPSSANTICLPVHSSIQQYPTIEIQKADAHIKMGEFYLRAESYDSAIGCFVKAASQSANKIAYARANAYLGKILYCGYGIEANHTVAYSYFRSALLQEDDLWAKAQAWFYLAQMHYFGHLGEKNIGLATEYMEQVVLQNDAPDLQERASQILNIIQSTTAECCICKSNELAEETVLPCYHTFHTACLNRWFEEQRNCPVCRNNDL